MGMVAFTFYGAWAAWANHEHGATTIAIAALTQGTLSFTVTTLVTTAMIETFRRISGRRARFLLTASGPMAAVLLIMATVHWLVGTPNVWQTIAPSALFGSIYCVAYTWSLTRTRPSDAP